MGSKVCIISLALLLATLVLLFSFEVTADQTSKEASANELNDAKYGGGGYQGGGGGGYQGGGGGYQGGGGGHQGGGGGYQGGGGGYQGGGGGHGGGGGGGRCRYGCCRGGGRYHDCYRCCSFAGEKADEVQH
ncbi:hypothetical protein ACFE04_018660 [Oxalis oulophora]